MFGLRRLLVPALALLAAAGPLCAQRGLPPSTEALVLMKVLAYDRALARGTGDIVVALLYDPSGGSSMEAKDEMMPFFRNASYTRINGRAVRLVEMDATSARLADDFKSHEVTAAYVTRGLDSRLGVILRAAERSGVITLGGSGDLAERGVAVGVANQAGRASLVINLPAARRSGADLSSAVLRLATVVQ